MSAQQIPCGKQGLRGAARGLSNGAERLRVRRRRGERRNLGLHGTASVAFMFRSRAFASRAAMSAGASPHVPVLLSEVLAQLEPQAGGIYVDATFGAGGYSRAVLGTEGTRVIGIDRDRRAIAGGFDLVEEAAGRLTLVEDRFSHLVEVCAAQGLDRVDGVVMDVGVSSMQLDQAGRGFSFRLDGPLDMRMADHGPSASEVIARASEAELADIIYLFGEERHSRSVARAIVAARKEAPITTTRALADIVARTVRSKPGDIHPATRTFQGLRIFVNDELDELQLALEAAERVLKPGGRHLPEVAQVPPSLELLTRRPLTPADDEVAANPRARSAKLRAARRTEAAAQPPQALPTWPRLADVMRGG
jgi:16S rRNA (cytosine1402-N4)-methyltransferase